MTDDFESFSGAISLYDGDEALELRCQGCSNISAGSRNDALTSFGMASGCKIFTALAILQLAEGGAFSLDQSVNALIGDYRVHPAITLRQLLAHRSGLPDYFDEETMSDYGMLRPEDFFPLFMGRDCAFEPGSRFAYSNSGFVLLAYVVERAAGESFPGYIRRNIIERCAMGATGYYRLDMPPPNTAVGYIPEGGSFRSNVYSVPIIGGGDGGCFSCGRDMNRFWRALRDEGGPLLRPETARGMLAAGELDTGEDDRYGLGVWISGSDPDLAFVQGSDPGVRFLSCSHARSGRTLTVCSNTENRLGGIFRDYAPKLKPGLRPG